MKFFIDSAEVSQIAELSETGLVDGVTTNPSLIAKSGRDFKEVIKEICSIINGPVSAEVAATDKENMLREGEYLAGLAENIVIKLPMSWDGLKVCKIFQEKNIKTNLTLCFSANQALLAAKAGATYISPFIGRLDDINLDGMQLIADIRAIYNNYSFSTQILAASIRSVNHVSEAAIIGADIATIPPKILHQLVNHPLTDKGIDSFVRDWKSTGQSIL